MQRNTIHRRLIRPGIFIFLTFFLTQIAWAYPGFGKRIDTSVTKSCNQCHVVFPKLRQYGRTIREIGYNVPITETDDSKLKALYRFIPIALRGKVFVTGTDSEKKVELSLVQLLSAGTFLNNKFAWWFHKHLIEENELVPLNEGAPHEAWLQYNLSESANLRAGMFELPFWFSPLKTRLSETDYLYFGATGNPDMSGTLTAPQFGFAVNGYLGKGPDEDDWGDETDDNYAEGYNYAVSVTNGESSFENTSFNTFYGRITKKEYAYAIGLWSLTGKAVQEESQEMDDMDHMDEDEHEEDSIESSMYYRLGADVDLFLKGDDINLYGSLVYGKDINNDFIGGFLGHDQMITQKILGTIRVDAVNFLGDGGDMDMGDEHGDDDHDSGSEEEAGGGHGGHGLVLMDDASSVSVGLYYIPFANIRVGFDYVYGINNIETKGIFQIQFGF